MKSSFTVRRAGKESAQNKKEGKRGQQDVKEEGADPLDEGETVLLYVQREAPLSPSQSTSLLPNTLNTRFAYTPIGLWLLFRTKAQN